MGQELLSAGGKVHIITRRLFPDDIRRHFCGVVSAATTGSLRAVGYVFVYNAATNEYVRRTPARDRIFSLDSGNIINSMPETIDIEMVQYRRVEGRLVVTDQQDYVLDINEFGPGAS